MENIGRLDEKDNIVMTGDIHTMNENDETVNDLATRIKSLYDEYQNRDINDILQEAYNVIDNRTYESPLEKHKNKQLREERDEFSQQIDYGEGVISKRLIDGKLYDVNLLDIDDDDKEEEFNLANSVFRNRYADDANAKDVNSSKKLDKVIKRAISNVKEMLSIKVFKLISFLWIVSIALMSSFQLISSDSYFSNTNNLIDLLLEANAQLAYFSRINSDLLDIEYLSKSYFQENDFINLAQIYSQLNSTTNEVLSNTKQLISKSYLTIINREDEQFKFYDYSSVQAGDTSNYFSLGLDHHTDMVSYV